MADEIELVLRAAKGDSAACGLLTLAATVAADDGSVPPFPPSKDECGRMKH